MLDKMGGVWAPKPSAGPHKQRECLPLCILLRNRLKYALNLSEAKAILIQRQVKVDGKVRVDHTYPAGLMDVITIEKTKEHFRLLYDTKGRFVLHKISPEEAKYKLCRVQSIARGPKGVTHCTTHDGRTVRFPHPEVRTHDTIRFNLITGQIDEATATNPSHLKFEHGNLCVIMGGNNIGRVGVLQHREKHAGSFEIVHLKDKMGHHFATRLNNVMVIGKGEQRWVTLPKGDGVKLNIVEDRLKKKEQRK
jgi:small subunit ribosomal protein S4e